MNSEHTHLEGVFTLEQLH
uniref:Uncharacterized protein n=1 Tax=Anguilla anguilla TaxID=7936 RepID=A0A0E9X7Y4_ANGAN